MESNLTGMHNTIVKDVFILTPEMKENYVLLLHLKYRGNHSLAASKMGLDISALKEYDSGYKDAINDYLPTTEAVPSADEIIERGLRRLNDMIEMATDPQKITSAMKVINEMKKAKRRSDAESVYDKINKIILGEEQ